MKKFLSVLAFFVSITSYSAPVFANDEVNANLNEITSEDSTNPEESELVAEWNRNGGTVCRARNILGRTFNVREDWRRPQRWVAERAVTECRQRSLPLIARTCRLVGCQQIGNDNDNGPGRRDIRVLSAVYGSNCEGRGENATRELARACDGRSSCAYTVDVRRLGDPAYGCRKDFRVQYECGGRTERAYLSPEADGQTLQIRCGR
jgi:hypothetical protein